MLSRTPRLLFAAASSGSGKTTVVCAVLRALVKRGGRVSSFKCGPDYIDPMFHRESIGTEVSSNLDLFLSDEGTVRRLLVENAARTQLSVAEGAMGYYDGVACTDETSAYAVARVTGMPVVLVVDCRRSAATAAAVVKGMQLFRPDANIQAVLLNRLSAARYPEMRALIERECGVKVVGFLPEMGDCSLESRHLGLVTAQEVTGLTDQLDRLAAQAERTIDLALLECIASQAPPLEYEPLALPEPCAAPVIAVARDRAFCFYYADTLRLLERLGARLCFFSPLADRTLPACHGLLLGGGYPELSAGALSENREMRESIGRAVAGGLPTVAECGGFLYLHRTLADEEKKQWPMAGVIDADAFPAGRLKRFGYLSLAARAGGLLCEAGETLQAHEFHYWESEDPGDAFCAQKPGRADAGWRCGYHGKLWYAGFPHLYFPGNWRAAARFVAACVNRKEQRLNLYRGFTKE